MRKHLPARPNLEHLGTQARALLTRLRDGDAKAVKTFVGYLPEAATLSPQQVRERGFRLADAQAAIGRKTEFAAWPGLARHVDRLRRMEGTWTFRSFEVDGQPVPSTMLASSLMLIDGDRFRMESPQATTRGSGHALEVLVRAASERPAGVDGGTPSAPSPTPAKPVDPGDFEAALSPNIERLQGEREPLELVTSGTPLQAAWLPFGSRTHSGVETKVVFGGQTMLYARMRFNETAMPVEVDYLNLTGKGKGSISLGLFRWDGDEAVLCIAPSGAPRPSDFSCNTGSGRTLSRWKRKGCACRSPLPRFADLSGYLVADPGYVVSHE